MRADAEPDVERPLELDARRRSRELQVAALGRQEQRDVPASLHDPHAPGADHVSLDLVGVRALGLADLQRREAIAMHRDVDVGRVGVERLAEDQARLAMGIGAAPDERDVGLESQVALDLLPGEVEGILRDPHVLAAARDDVLPRRLVKFRRAGMKHLANVAMPLEDPHRGLRRVLGNGEGSHEARHEERGESDRQRARNHGRPSVVVALDGEKGWSAVGIHHEALPPGVGHGQSLAGLQFLA